MRATISGAGLRRRGMGKDYGIGATLGTRHAQSRLTIAGATIPAVL